MNAIDPTGLQCTQDEKKRLEEAIAETKKDMAWAQHFVDYYSNPSTALEAQLGIGAHLAAATAGTTPQQAIQDFKDRAQFKVDWDKTELEGLQKQLDDCNKPKPKPKKGQSKRQGSIGQGVTGTHPVKKN